MKIFAASTCVLTLLLLVSFFAHSQSVSNDYSPTQKAQPTPPVKEMTEEIAKPTPTCTPQPTPLSEATRDDPDKREFGEDEDSDCDGIRDRVDNCVLNFNPNQKDSNHDGKGDACDPKLVDKSFVDMRCDGDGDGVPDNKDNCNLFCNPNQELIDVNNNKIHDACDPAIPDLARPLRSCTKRIKVKAPNPPKLNKPGSE
jgi:hypothetical protein